VERRPVAPDLFEGEGDDARLIAGRDRGTGEIVFPLPSGAERERFEAIRLSAEGRLWSFTVQRFRPKPPYDDGADEAAFRPYAVGYVELPDGVVVESRLQVEDLSDLRLDLPLHVTTERLRCDPDGAEVLTYAFRPMASALRGTR
jgi:uncharacterized OB-fold protein